MRLGKAMIKAVIDTNVLVSFLLRSKNIENIFRKVSIGAVQIFLSNEIIAEFDKVLNYKKFKFTYEEKSSIMSYILDISNIVDIKERFDVVRDKDDNKFIDCAVNAHVDFLITGDSDLLVLKEFGGVKIVTPSEFLKIIF